MKKFKTYKGLNFPEINSNILEFWEENDIFNKSLNKVENKKPFIFYEGPPSANGMPGIHHIISRTIKDTFCRYKTMKGYSVQRKAGWDTHGLPVELAVEKKLNITKDDIGQRVTVEEYNKTCKDEVMKYTDKWEEITSIMGYWLDLENPYITYDSKYIESVWWLLKQFYKKDLLYKGYTIQPYSPAAGTGLSSHELNMPGCYQDVKDTTGIAMFKAIRNSKSELLHKNLATDLFFLAWTTTPWTLLSNTALAVGNKINYLRILTISPYTLKAITVIIAEKLAGKLFPDENKDLSFVDYKKGSKKIPFAIIGSYTGEELVDISYEQLLPYHQPKDGDAFRVIPGDFVSTEEGTGIVHIAPSFGADDMRVAKQKGIGSLTLVNKKGCFIEDMGEFSGRYVKKAYDKNSKPNQDEVDVDIIVKLKKENKLFKAEKYEHSYPHCWRTKKPILYYPLDSWFIKSTAHKERMQELNKTINWQPPTTGERRFGDWLENLVDWNLSRSRFWGTPLPIWRTKDGKKEICIGSYKELKDEINKSVELGFMTENPLKDFKENDFSKENYAQFDPHRPKVDDIILASENNEKMYREPDLIDVWFDSGAMPYAQIHYPFETKELEGNFPCDFISEGVDQTRGWFFTLHAISTMLFDSVAYKNILSHGLILDEKGNKMSKSQGNAVDPFEIINKYGADPLRWYMLTNASPWESLKFSERALVDIQRKLFGTLYNTYSFFSLYANIDGFTFKEDKIPVENRPILDRWILSLLNTLIKTTEEHFENYDPTKAGRAIQNFVADHLSNWYVRLNRKRFWGGTYNSDKIAAYQTLYTCLTTIAKLMTPITPFFTERLFLDLNNITSLEKVASIHLSEFPKYNSEIINLELEENMDIAQKISSMSLSLRRLSKLKVRQPLSRIVIPVLDENFATKIDFIKDIILTEINVKDIELIKDTAGIITKKIKPNFKLLGRKLGKNMKFISQSFGSFTQDDIAKMEQDGKYNFDLNGENIEILLSEVEIESSDMPGWLVVTEGKYTVALDINVTPELREEGIAREFVNRIQNLRKDIGLDVTDKINLQIQEHAEIKQAINNNKDYIMSQTLSVSIEFPKKIEEGEQGTKFVEIDEELTTYIKINKMI